MSGKIKYSKNRKKREIWGKSEWTSGFYRKLERKRLEGWAFGDSKFQIDLALDKVPRPTSTYRRNASCIASHRQHVVHMCNEPTIDQRPEWIVQFCSSSGFCACCATPSLTHRTTDARGMVQSTISGSVSFVAQCWAMATWWWKTTRSTRR